MKKIITLGVLLLIIVLGTVGYFWTKNTNKNQKASIPTNTEIQPSPTNTQPTVLSPLPDSKISSPLMVKGTVPPGWMFEGVFPVKLVDSNFKVISQSQAKETIPGDWSSGKAADFNATITFTTSEKSGYLILEKDNPSGLPENDANFSIPITF